MSEGKASSGARTRRDTVSSGRGLGCRERKKRHARGRGGQGDAGEHVGAGRFFTGAAARKKLELPAALLCEKEKGGKERKGELGRDLRSGRRGDGAVVRRRGNSEGSMECDGTRAGAGLPGDSWARTMTTWVATLCQWR